MTKDDDDEDEDEDEDEDNRHNFHMLPESFDCQHETDSGDLVDGSRVGN